MAVDLGLGGAARVTVVVVSIYVPHTKKTRHHGAAHPPPRCLLSQRVDRHTLYPLLLTFFLGCCCFLLRRAGSAAVPASQSSSTSCLTLVPYSTFLDDFCFCWRRRD